VFPFCHSFADRLLTTVVQVLLNENDALWSHFRHQHISDTIEAISAKFKDHMKTQGAQLAKGELTDISSMADGVRQLAQYQEQAGKLAQHMQVRVRLEVRKYVRNSMYNFSLVFLVAALFLV
jgi:hypothetical protein